MIIVRYFTKEQLLNAVKTAERKKFNRRGMIERVRVLESHLKFPVVFEIIHEHKSGEPSEAHMRCVVLLDDRSNTMVIDVDMPTYRSLEYSYYEVTSPLHLKQ